MYDFTGLTLDKSPTYGRCTANDITGAIEYCKMFGIDVCSVQRAGFSSSADLEAILELHDGKKPDPTVWCYECEYSKKRYHENASGNDDIYYYCTNWESCTNSTDYCSRGVRKPKEGSE